MSRGGRVQRGDKPVEGRQWDSGIRLNQTDLDSRKVKQLQRENFELKRANEILKKAAAFFAQAELDRRAK